MKTGFSQARGEVLWDVILRVAKKALKVKNVLK